MKTEEKAKAYDKAAAKAMELFNSPRTCFDINQLTEMFPGLKDDEDEKTREFLINFIKLENGANLSPDDAERCIAYLEKQKVNNPAEDSEKEPEWSPSEGEMGVLYKLCYISNQISDKDDTELTRLYQDLKREYFNGRSFENMFLNEKQEEQSTAEYIKRNSKEWYALLAEQYDKGYWKGKLENQNTEQQPAEIDEYEIIKKHITESALSGEVNKRLEECGWHVTDEKPAEWSGKDEDMLRDICSDLLAGTAFNIEFQTIAKKKINWLKTRLKSCRPSLRSELSKEEKKHLYNAIEAVKYVYDVSEGSGAQCIEFLKSLPERLNIQPKQEWSKEDEDTIENAICILETNFKPNEGFTGLDINRNQLVERLKSLRPQPHWKPSKEQMEALFTASERNDRLGAILNSLYDDLKKL